MSTNSIVQNYTPERRVRLNSLLKEAFPRASSPDVGEIAKLALSKRPISIPPDREKSLTYRVESSPGKTVRVLFGSQKGSHKVVFRSLTFTRDQKRELHAVKELKNYEPNNETEFDKEEWVMNTVKTSLLERFEHAREFLDLPIERGYNSKNQPRLISKYSDNTLASRPLTSEIALPCTLQTFLDVSQGLVYLHESGIIHTDIKPENILAPDSNNRGKLTDFGLAKLINDPPPNLFFATPLYLPPEYKNKTMNFQSDVYALGLSLMFELEQKVFPVLLNQQAANSKIGQNILKQLADFKTYASPKLCSREEAQKFKNTGHYVRFKAKNHYYIFPTWNMRSRLWNQIIQALEPSLSSHEYDALTSLYNLALQTIKGPNIRPNAIGFHQKIKDIHTRTHLSWPEQNRTKNTSLTLAKFNEHTQSSTSKRRRPSLPSIPSQSSERKRLRPEASSSSSS